MTTKSDLMTVMEKHIGKSSGIKGSLLSLALDVTTRKVRSLITECREDGVAICGHPTTGYYVAKTAEELEETLVFLKRRALHSLKLASALSKLPLEDLVGQLHLRT